MDKKEEFYVIGDFAKVIDFIEYMELIGYKNIDSGLLRTNTVFIDPKNKSFFHTRDITSYRDTLDVEKDAEKIDSLIATDKNLTKARDEFYKALKEIEVKEPKEVKPENYSSFIVIGQNKDLTEFLDLMGYSAYGHPTTNFVFINTCSKIYSKHNNYTNVSITEFKGVFDVEKDSKRIIEMVDEAELLRKKRKVQIAVDKEDNIFTRTTTLDYLSDFVGVDKIGSTVFKDSPILGTGLKRGRTIAWTQNKIEEELHSKLLKQISTSEEGQWEEWERFKEDCRIETCDKLHNIKNGVKYNQDKLPIDTVLTKQFPNAVEALVKCSLYGHKKYEKFDKDWLNFKKVEGGSQTYADAAARHNQNKSKKDEESGLPHIFHKLWNVMAEVELWIEENDKK